MLAIQPEQNMLGGGEDMAMKPPDVPTTAAPHRVLSRSSAVSQKSVELSFQESSGNPLNKSKLATQRSVPDNQTGAKRALDLRRMKNSSIESTISLPNQKSLDKKQATLLHQKSIQNTQSDIVLSTQHSISDDRKALRDALYQGIFHRHRRTIFAVGSFLRMLRSKNSNYDSIRSDSDEV